MAHATHVVYPIEQTLQLTYSLIHVSSFGDNQKAVSCNNSETKSSTMYIRDHVFGVHTPTFVKNFTSGRFHLLFIYLIQCDITQCT